MTTCLRPVVSSLQPKLSLIKVRTSTSQSSLPRPTSTFLSEFLEPGSIPRNTTSSSSSSSSSESVSLPTCTWVETRSSVRLTTPLTKLPALSCHRGQLPVVAVATECHSYDPLIHMIPTKPLLLSDDDIILSCNWKEMSVMEEKEDLRRDVCMVMTLAEALPSQVSTWHRQCCSLSEYERRMILATDGKGTTSNTKPLDPTKKPSEEQLDKILFTLSDDLPEFFEHNLTYDIYHEDLVFQNNIRGATTCGKNVYIRQMAMLRLIGRLTFSYVQMDVLKISKHFEDGTVRARWRIRGTPTYKLLLKRLTFGGSNKTVQLESDWYDGYSTFYVGGDGLVHKHICDKMMPDEQREVSGNLAAKLAFLLGAIPQPSADELGNMVQALAKLQNMPSIESL